MHTLTTEILVVQAQCAQCAAMREALSRLLRFNEELCGDVGVSKHYYPSADLARAALATDAGKALLERLQRAEAELRAWEVGDADELEELERLRKSEAQWKARAEKAEAERDAARYATLQLDAIRKSREACPVCQSAIAKTDELIERLRRAEDLADGDLVEARLEPKLAEARAVLREVEWAACEIDGHGAPVGPPRCPSCLRETEWHDALGKSGGGHAPDCRLAKALEGK